jgi:DNA-binding NarL/FixJ family response regulator
VAGKKAKRANRRQASTSDDEITLNRQLERLGRMLALLLVKGEPQPQKIRTLSAAGFTNAQIAELLGITANAVTVSLYKQRRRR